jgi:hypothetical protein
MQKRYRRKRFVWIGAGSVLTFIVLIIMLAVANDLPGGFADWRMSHAMGLDGTLRIPLGKTPDEAVQKFRHFPSMQVIHREPVEGGVLLFIKRFYQHDSTDLQVEYVRKSWIGWKWVMGGGFGIGGSKVNKSAVTYMIMSKFEYAQTPFPMVFGDIMDGSVKKVIVTVDGHPPEKYAAKLGRSGPYDLVCVPSAVCL